MSFNSEEVLALENWIYVDQSGVSQPITLPTDLDINSGEVLIKTVLPSDIVLGESICIRSSMQAVSVSFDDHVIYEYGQTPSDYPGDMVGSSWNIIRIPPEYSGQEVSVTITSFHDSMNGVINDILYGSKNAIIYHLLSENFLGFILVLILFVWEFF